MPFWSFGACNIITPTLGVGDTRHRVPELLPPTNSDNLAEPIRHADRDLPAQETQVNSSLEEGTTSFSSF